MNSFTNTLTEKMAFNQLPKLSDINKSAYLGPHPESNKVVDGIFAGAFPGDIYDRLNQQNLIQILNAGVTKFVCLQLEYPAGFKPNPERPDIRPYFVDVLKIIANKENLPTLTAPIKNISFEHLPIKDLNITEDYKILKLAKKLVEFYRQGEVLYIHCWGGHGRTGVVVCLMIYLMYGTTADEALEYCNYVHKLRVNPVQITSPQTSEQMDQVRRIINKDKLIKCLEK